MKNYFNLELTEISGWISYLGINRMSIFILQATLDTSTFILYIPTLRYSSLIMVAVISAVVHFRSGPSSNDRLQPKLKPILAKSVVFLLATNFEYTKTEKRQQPIILSRRNKIGCRKLLFTYVATESNPKAISIRFLVAEKYPLQPKSRLLLDFLKTENTQIGSTMCYFDSDISLLIRRGRYRTLKIGTKRGTKTGVERLQFSETFGTS